MVTDFFYFFVQLHVRTALYVQCTDPESKVKQKNLKLLHGSNVRALDMVLVFSDLLL